MVACPNEACQRLGVFNRPFVKFCRRCGKPVHQEEFWESHRRDGWDLAPVEIDEPEVVANLWKLVRNQSRKILTCMAMIRGVLAIHHAGQYLALFKPTPDPDEEEVLWDAPETFPVIPGGSEAPPNVPTLLPDERRLMFSSLQGILILDLWSCHGISAKDREPRTRVLRLRERSIVVPPIPLDENKIGLVTRGWSDTQAMPYRWSIWDLSRPEHLDATVSAALDTEDGAVLPFRLGQWCRSEIVAGRVVTFATEEGHWVWKLADARESKLEAIRPTWPGPQPNPNDSLVLVEKDHKRRDDPNRFQRADGYSMQATLVYQQSFSWFYCVNRDIPSEFKSEERFEHYRVDFGKLGSENPQKVTLPPGARPIGAAPYRDNMLRMIFHAGSDLQIVDQDYRVRRHEGGLPGTRISTHLAGPLIVSVGQGARDQRYVQLGSLLHNRRIEAETGDRLRSDPLLWSRWLFTIELDPSDRLVVCRRFVHLG
jgi:hypothetical protein